MLYHVAAACVHVDQWWRYLVSWYVNGAGLASGKGAPQQ